MDPQVPSSQLRPAREDDIPAIARLSHDTLLVGRKADRVFPSEKLWGELFVAPYIRGGLCNWVAVVEGQVAGYILGAASNLGVFQGLWPSLPGIVWRYLVGAYGPRLPYLRYVLRLLLFPAPRAPHDPYPAHLHMAVDENVRGRGLGSRLLETFLDCLRAKGIRGVQLATTRANAAARRLYRRHGFRLYRRKASPFWAPYLGRPLIHEAWVLPLSGEGWAYRDAPAGPPSPGARRG
ncbi:MAG: GNAT family N-acetyltransferase [Bacillota bacterium]|nr:GNAT family N-acetyltransferase [Bacillota bacterium]